MISNKDCLVINSCIVFLKDGAMANKTGLSVRTQIKDQPFSDLSLFPLTTLHISAIRMIIAPTAAVTAKVETDAASEGSTSAMMLSKISELV